MRIISNPILLPVIFKLTDKDTESGTWNFSNNGKTAVIRAIQPSDNPQVAKVIRRTLEDIGMPKVGTAYADKSLDSMFETYQQERYKYYVLEIEGKIVGGAGVAPLDNFDGNVCELQKMYFLPQARGTGLGYEMLKICLNTAKDFKFSQCYLETMPFMENARRLYLKNGFESMSKPMGDTGHYSCSVWMIKDL